ncbi:hypothetical protein SDC9_104818 [bioreactor metagenome]|uniref:Uncharacterized protein n=1 Tax=bioreactor metagenome TaxID=1076179 RepID=A0A645AXZ0_9ZZZZ
MGAHRHPPPGAHHHRRGARPRRARGAGARHAPRPAQRRSGPGRHPRPRGVRPDPGALRARLQRPAGGHRADRRLDRPARGDGRPEEGHRGDARRRGGANRHPEPDRGHRHRADLPHHRPRRPRHRTAGAADPGGGTRLAGPLRHRDRGDRLHRGGDRRVAAARRGAAPVRHLRGRALHGAAHHGVPLAGGADQGHHRLPAVGPGLLRPHHARLHRRLRRPAGQRRGARAADLLPADHHDGHPLRPVDGLRGVPRLADAGGARPRPAGAGRRAHRFRRLLDRGRGGRGDHGVGLRLLRPRVRPRLAAADRLRADRRGGDRRVPGPDDARPGRDGPARRQGLVAAALAGRPAADARRRGVRSGPRTRAAALARPRRTDRADRRGAGRR